METNILIRHALMSDYDTVRYMNNKLNNYHQIKRTDIIKKELEQLSTNHFKSIVNSNNKVCYIAESNGRTIGFCIAKKCNYHNHSTIRDMTVVELEKLYVEENSRNLGVGTLLFEKIVDFANSHDAEKIELSVWGWNEAARHFYHQIGMQERYCRLEINC